MRDRRPSLRKRVLKGGKIRFGRASAIDCMIRNLSEKGACLLVESPIGIPETFQLQIANESVIWKCRVAWRKEKLIGVEFQ